MFIFIRFAGFNTEIANGREWDAFDTERDAFSLEWAAFSMQWDAFSTEWEVFSTERDGMGLSRPSGPCRRRWRRLPKAA